MPLTSAALQRDDEVGLRLEDVLSNEAYARCRPQYRASIIALKRSRRVALGPNASITFECRATVLFQIQEVMWIESRAGIEALSREIETYACLIPPRRGLRASLMIHGGPATFSEIALVAGDRAASGVELAPGDPADPVRYLGFSIDDLLLARLDRGEPAHLRVKWRDVEAITPLPRPLRDALAGEAAGLPGPGLAPSAFQMFLGGDDSPHARPIHLASENHHVRPGGPQGP